MIDLKELKQKAIENVCKRNPHVVKEWFIDAFKKYDKGERVKYLKDCEIAEYESYIAGATENGIQWHKTVDGDLPEDTSVKRVFVGNNEYYRLYYSYGKWYYSDKGGLSFIDNVIAWCEEPLFKE